MSRYDGLIIPRSYSEYINKTDAATLSQALQLAGVLAQSVSEGNNAAVTSNAVNSALSDYLKVLMTQAGKTANYLNNATEVHIANNDNTKYITLNAYDLVAVDNDSTYTRLISLRDLIPIQIKKNTNQLSYTKVNKMVYLNAIAFADVTLSITGIAAGLIPAGYRPQENLFFKGILYRAEADCYDATIDIRPNGDVMFHIRTQFNARSPITNTMLNAGYKIYFSAIWPI